MDSQGNCNDVYCFCCCCSVVVVLFSLGWGGAGEAGGGLGRHTKGQTITDMIRYAVTETGQNEERIQ